MFLAALFNLYFSKKCFHDKITPNVDFAYCPDCGKLIKNEWYITRCACCGVKIRAMHKNGEIISQDNYCSNCGSQEYIVEKLDKINFIDINYAVLLKREIEKDIITANSTQCWQEKSNEQPKLLIQYL